ncbi:type IV secretory system conjugative DNA transfer family protein [Vibrio vulnificus]|nr:type IV secretory system conjugative DNA transfer family protein [Vibrio vulnificus]MCU8171440.1 type IV secretory system conjugative DNA transfer family protein [Vibrio vulnificus]
MIQIAEPVNGNNELDCHNALYVGSSGSGKTTAVKTFNIAADDCVVFFDPYGDYSGTFKGQPVFTYYNWADFAENLFKARSSGMPFKIARGFEGRIEKGDFELFCGLAWACGDGSKRPLNVVLEEYAKFCDTAGKADGYSGDLIRIGRKFGLRTHPVFQRGQEVSKTVMGNCPIKWIGYQDRDNDAIYLSKELGVPSDAIANLQRLEYIIKTEKHDKGEFEKGAHSFKK